MVEPIPQDFVAGAGKPSVEDRGVDPAKVEGKLRVAVHKVFKVRSSAVKPGPHRWAQRCCRETVPGARGP